VQEGAVTVGAPCARSELRRGVGREKMCSHESMKSLGITVLCCLTVLSCVLVASRTFETRPRPHDRVLTGLARQESGSDPIVWRGRFVRRASARPLL